MHLAEGVRIARRQLRVCPQLLRSVVNRAVHIRERDILDVSDAEVMAKLVDDERPVFARVVDARRHDPDPPALGERHMPRPIGVPRLELVGPIELLDDEVAPAGCEADAPARPFLPDAHRLGDEIAFVGIELGVERVRDGSIALAGACRGVTDRLGRTRSQRAHETRKCDGSP